jgi:hypothetical protein
MFELLIVLLVIIFSLFFSPWDWSPQRDREREADRARLQQVRQYLRDAQQAAPSAYGWGYWLVTLGLVGTVCISNIWVLWRASSLFEPPLLLIIMTFCTWILELCCWWQLERALGAYSEAAWAGGIQAVQTLFWWIVLNQILFIGVYIYIVQPYVGD